MIKLAEKIEKEEVLMRDVYCNTLMDMAEKDSRIVILDADLMNSMGTMPFAKKYPERTFDCGIQEANMIGVAAGLSATGKIPYAHTFGPFATRRCFDQVFISAAYAKLNVRIIGSDPGITAAFNGGTHMPFEDIGLMRTIPDITIIEPVDSIMLEDMIRQLKDKYGVYYVRLLRKNAMQVYEQGSTFEIGKGITLREGKDVTIISTGIMVSESLKAAKLLEKEGISAKVGNIFTIKPIDKDFILECAKQTGAMVTAENHNIINGLGSAVAEVVSENYPIPMGRIGSQDLFGEVGSVDYLQKRYKMTAQDIVNKAKEVIAKK